jgi:hypothetical protein
VHVLEVAESIKDVVVLKDKALIVVPKCERGQDKACAIGVLKTG